MQGSSAVLSHLTTQQIWQPETVYTPADITSKMKI